MLRLLCLLIASSMASANGPDSWPGFRGDGSSRTTANLPTTWSPKENVAWRVDILGYGQSSPVVWKGKIFLSSVEGDEKETLHAACFDLQTGKLSWKKSFNASQKGKNNPMMSRAACTPVVDANGVYFLFESGDMLGLSHSGDVHWERHFAKEFGELKNNHGLGSSLAQTDNAAIVLLDHQAPSHLIAIDKKTGKDLWKADRPARSSWTSPIVAAIDGKEFVLVSSGGAVSAYDAAKGQLIWEMSGLVGNSIPSATMCDGRLYVAAGENRMKPDPKATSESNCCIQLNSQMSTGYEVLWKAKKLATGTSSPLVYEGLAYFVDKNGSVHCLDAKTGEEKFTERLDNQQWATPIGAGGHVYFFGKDGITTVLKAGSNFEKIASNRIWSAEDYQLRKDAAKKAAAATLPKPPEGKGPAKGPGGGPPLPKEELEATRYSAVGDVVYGVAAVEGTILLRTGTELICIRK
jgi:outer membrane protein assembly factor BamB